MTKSSGIFLLYEPEQSKSKDMESGKTKPNKEEPGGT